MAKVWPFVALCALPELFLTGSITSILSGARFMAGRSLAVSLCYLPLLLYMRANLTFGFHTIVSIFVFPVLISLFFRCSYSRAIKNLVVTVFVIVCLEIATAVFLRTCFKLYPPYSEWQRTALSTPVNMALAVILFWQLFRKRGRVPRSGFNKLRKG